MPKTPNNPSVATYSFNGMDLRVVEIDGEPWFVAVDACKILGYRQAASYYTQKLDGSERRVVTRREVSQFNLETSIFSGPSAPSTTLISESGLYKLTMRSDKKEAKQFQEWVTREVLPSIRKTGTYTMPGAKKAIEAPKPSKAKNVPPPL